MAANKVDKELLATLTSRLPSFVYDKDVFARPTSSFLVLDFEASYGAGPLDPERELILACWYVYREGVLTERKFCWGDEFSQGALVRDINSVDFIVAHNAKYEMQWLKLCGVELRNVVAYCTYLAQWVLDGNESLRRSLGDLCRRYAVSAKWDLIRLLWDTGLETADIPREWLLEYCLQDVESTAEIFFKQREIVYARDQQHLVLQRGLTAACLADIEFNGMFLDELEVQKEYDKVSSRVLELEHELADMAGETNLNSPKQLAVLLYETLRFKVPKDARGKEKTTKSGERPTDSATLLTLTATTEKQKTFLSTYKEYNKLSSLLSKNLVFFKGVCDHRGGTFRASFNQGVTATHRLSSSGRPILFPGEKKPKSAQFQNLPREYKRLFWSGDDDYVLGEADGSQLEFRWAADLCRDTAAYHDIVNGTDVHAVTAKTLTENGQPTDRQGAKAKTFSPLFGGMGTTEAEKAYVRLFREKYKEIDNTQRSWALKVLETKELRTPLGIIYRWPDTTMSSRTGYITNTTSIYNYPIQGGATAEIIPVAMLMMWYLFSEQDVKLLNTVHDSVVAKVRLGAVSWYKEVTPLCFTSLVYDYLQKVYGYTFRVPLGCGIKVARNWGDTSEETSYDVYPDNTFIVKEKS